MSRSSNNLFSPSDEVFCPIRFNIGELNGNISEVDMGDTGELNGNISEVDMGDTGELNGNISEVDMGDTGELNGNISEVDMGDTGELNVIDEDTASLHDVCD